MALLTGTEDIKNLSVRRGQIRANITRFKKYLDNIDELNVDILDIKQRLKNYVINFQKFDEIQSQLEILDDTFEKDNTRETFETDYYQLLNRAERLIINSESSVNSCSNGQSNTNIAVKSFEVNDLHARMPVINIQPFSGAYSQWLSFFDSFSSLVDSHPSLSEVLKLHYLKSSLKGDALDLIQDLETCSENYSIAMQLLKDNYNKERLIVQDHVRLILNAPECRRESYTDLKQLVNIVHRNLRSLKRLKRPVESWDDLLVPIILAKLDYKTAHEWEAKLTKNKLPTVNELMDFLSHKVDFLETMQVQQKHSLQGVKPSKKSTAHVVTKGSHCQLCSDNHPLYKCPEFLKLNSEQRLKSVKALKLCVNCFDSRHISRACKHGNCQICRRRHNTLLHIEESNSERQISSANKGETGHTVKNSVENPSESYSSIDNKMNKTDNICAYVSSATDEVLLSTALVYVFDSKGNKHVCRVLLDQGSQLNLITESCVQKLNLARKKSEICISGVNQSDSSSKEFVTAKIQSRCASYQNTINLVILSNITKKLPLNSFSVKDFKIPKHVNLADPEFNVSRKIDILIGAEIFYNLLCVGQIAPIEPGQPLLQKTLLGWLVTGKISSQSNNKRSTIICNLAINDNLDRQLKRFWKIDEVSFRENYSIEERSCETFFLKTHTRDSGGRFVVELPFKRDTTNLGESRCQAIKRFLNLERKLLKQPQLKEQYHSFMAEYIQLGHMTKIKHHKDFDPHFYLPHHAVLKESSITTKLRVVFDASAKTTSGYSLNDLLMVGPVIQQDIFAILTRFRMHKYVITSDIAKMYRQVLVSLNDRRFQRIVWRFNPKDDISTFELNTITYGTAPASFLATRCLQQLAIENKDKLPVGSAAILSDFYVDDFLSGGNDEQEVKRIRDEVISILRLGQFELRKWASNNPRLLSGIDSQEENSLLNVDQDTTIKMLGLQWNSIHDHFQFAIKGFEVPVRVTKRNILSDISQIFDPIGFLTPIIILAKVLVQRLWQQNIGWDESVGLDVHTTWLDYRKSLEQLNKVSIPRYVLSSSKLNSIEIHGFSDASEIAYGAALYVRVSFDDNYASNLLCSKSRVAPLKALSIPRLELCAAVLLAQLVKKTVKTLNSNINRIVLWTDSSIVLSWINSSSRLYNTFVANRVGEIQNLTEVECWRHVRSADNPSDLISRGIQPNQIINNSLWWHGPHWLSQAESFWPKFDIATISKSDMEMKRSAVSQLTTGEPEWFIFSRFSSFDRLIRVTAYCARFCNNIRNKNRTTGSLSSNELRRATLSLVKIVQAIDFREDIQELKKHGVIKKSSRLVSLHPFLDADGIIRVGGRLQNANFPFDTKHPILLPAKHSFTNLVIVNFHKRYLHAGPEGTLAAIRQKFWILSARNCVKKIIRNCVICFKVSPSISQPSMGNLPIERLSLSRPFLISGVDYCGPFKVKEGSYRCKRFTKSYAAIFVCFSTKAVHIELVSNLTSEAFIAALKRFVARRGKVKQIYSDNGTNFVGSNSELKEIYNFLQKPANLAKVNETVVNEGIDWKFIPARSPHFGGLWEAAVKSVKYHLRRVAGDASLTFEELNTLLIEIEAILNSRPITPISNDPNDLTFLTPGHFLIGEHVTAIPELDLEHQATNKLSRWQRVCQLKQHFWSRWSKEYLGQLHQRRKWKCSSGRTLESGQLVLLKDENLPPLRWKLGRVTEVHPGKDGIVRAATVKTSAGEVKRAAIKLSILPIDSSETK